MKFIASLLALSCLTGVTLFAQDSAPAPVTPSYSVAVDFSYASKYVFRGVRYSEESFQPSLKLTSGSFYACLWTNQPITSNTDNEIDLNGGYGFKLSDTWKLDVGATLYYYPELDKSTGLDSSTKGRKRVLRCVCTCSSMCDYQRHILLLDLYACVTVSEIGTTN